MQEPIVTRNPLQNGEPSKCDEKFDFFRGFGHLLQTKKKFKDISDWPPGDVKPGQENE